MHTNTTPTHPKRSLPPTSLSDLPVPKRRRTHSPAMYASTSVAQTPTPRGLKPLRLRCSALSLPVGAARSALPPPAPRPRLLYTNDGMPIPVHPLERTPAFLEKRACRSKPSRACALPARLTRLGRSPLNPRVDLDDEDESEEGETYLRLRRRGHEPNMCLRRAALEAHLRATPAGRADLATYGRVMLSRRLGVEADINTMEEGREGEMVRTRTRAGVQDARSATRELERLVCGEDDDVDMDVDVESDGKTGAMMELIRFDSDQDAEGEDDSKVIVADIEMHEPAPPFPVLPPAQPITVPTNPRRPSIRTRSFTTPSPRPRTRPYLPRRTRTQPWPLSPTAGRVAFPSMAPLPYALALPSWHTTYISTGHAVPRSVSTTQVIPHSVCMYA